MSTKLSKEKIEKIQELKKQGYSRYEISQGLGISWGTVNKYFGNELNFSEMKLTPKDVKNSNARIDNGSIYNVDPEISTAIFKLFREGKEPVDVICEGFKARDVDLLWNLYVTYKGQSPTMFKIYHERMQNMIFMMRQLVMNFKHIIYTIDSNDDLFICPNCHKYTHFSLTSEKRIVCTKCGKLVL